MDNNSTYDTESNVQTSIQQHSHKSELTLYGITIDSKYIKEFCPSEIKNFEKYQISSKVYEDPLAATTILIAYDDLGRQHAIKKMNKSKLKLSHNIELAKIEFIVHLYLSKKSNYIVEAYECYENENEFILVMEYCSNPNYFQYRLENKLKEFSNEDILRHYAKCILEALAVIHAHNIIHCDIKPDNFLLFKKGKNMNNSSFDSDNSSNSNDDEDWENDIVKICDFGLSHVISTGKKKVYLKYVCGTHGYNAPEKKNDSYIDTSVDMWSFGICLYQMAVAYKPTAIKNYKYCTGPIPYLQSNWKKFDYKNLQNLIESCLKVNPEERITAAQALEHPWFKVIKK